MLQAVNNYLFIQRDPVEQSVGGLLLPSGSAEKPHRGTVLSVGDLVQDLKIKAAEGRKVVFHRGNGFDIEVDGVTYLVLEDKQVIGIL